MQYENVKLWKTYFKKFVPFKNCFYVFVKGNEFLSLVYSLFTYSTKHLLNISSISRYDVMPWITLLKEHTVY